MPNYECSRCHKVFKQKCDYDRHMKRKNLCKEKIKIEVDSELKGFLPSQKTGFRAGEILCPFCEKKFVKKSNVLRHINNNVCQAKKQMIKIAEKNEKLEQEVKNLQLQITNINSNNNTTNNITQNITIVAYGKEDISRITNKDFRSIMRRGMLSIPELVRRIHFDEKVPENHNVYISNLRGRYVLMHDGKKWRLADIKEALQQIYGDHYDILETKFEELIGEDSLDELTVDKFRTFLNYVNSNGYINEDDEQETPPNKYIEMVKEDLKKLLYENHDIVEKTKKQVNS
jgi:uncharacterized C2H2 Zn-finger protein